MKDTLKVLYDLQLQALDKGISFNIDLGYDKQKNPLVNVGLTYTVTGDLSKGYVLNTTLSDIFCKSKNQYRIKSISHFISTVTEPVDNI